MQKLSYNLDKKNLNSEVSLSSNYTRRHLVTSRIYGLFASAAQFTLMVSIMKYG